MGRRKSEMGVGGREARSGKEKRKGKGKERRRRKQTSVPVAFVAGISAERSNYMTRVAALRAQEVIENSNGTSYLACS